MSYTRICVGCNTEFETDNYRKIRCVKNCGAARNVTRTAQRDEHDVEFIGVDGEGVTHADGTHDYVLFSVGDRSLHRNGRGLHYDEIFEFLYDHFLDHEDAAYVGFFLGYDFTQWLKTLPQNRAFMLLHKAGIAKRQPHSDRLRFPFPVNSGNWQFDILGEKRFKLRPYIPRGEGDPMPWMYICDAGPFFQTSFLSVLDPKQWPGHKPPIPLDQYNLILEGKQRRATAEFDDDMIRYNIAENQALSVVMSNLNRGFVHAGVKLKKNQWFGPGQAAAFWLNEHCDHYSKTTEHHVGLVDIVPRDVIELARAAYYGGWFEIFAHGHIPGPTWEYDINSAYPHAISQLPCLLHGEWYTSKRPQTRYALCDVTITVHDPNRIMGGLPCRDKNGKILRISRVTGVYWRHEIDALKAIPGLHVRVKYNTVRNYRECDCPPPLREITELYRQRIELGEEGKNSPAGKSLKLLYNSMYGKLCQSIGSPQFANPVWASFITSHTRTAILNAIGTHPAGTADLLMVATDGVYFRSAHPGLHLSKTELGAWDETVKNNMLLFLPGIYWDDTTRETIRKNEAPKLKSRGISASALSRCIDDIDEKFRHIGVNDHTPELWPEIEVPLSFSMTTARQAITRNAWHTAGHVTSDDSKTLKSWPITKRNPANMFYDRGLLRCEPHNISLESEPYSQTFGIEYSEEPLTPDGETTMLLSNMLH